MDQTHSSYVPQQGIMSLCRVGGDLERRQQLIVNCYAMSYGWITTSYLHDPHYSLLTDWLCRTWMSFDWNEWAHGANRMPIAPWSFLCNKGRVEQKYHEVPMKSSIDLCENAHFVVEKSRNKSCCLCHRMSTRHAQTSTQRSKLCEILCRSLLKLCSS